MINNLLTVLHEAEQFAQEAYNKALFEASLNISEEEMLALAGEDIIESDEYISDFDKDFFITPSKAVRRATRKANAKHKALKNEKKTFSKKRKSRLQEGCYRHSYESKDSMYKNKRINVNDICSIIGYNSTIFSDLEEPIFFSFLVSEKYCRFSGSMPDCYFAIGVDGEKIYQSALEMMYKGWEFEEYFRAFDFEEWKEKHRLSRSDFPYVIRNKFGEVVFFTKTEKEAQDYINNFFCIENF